MSSKVSWDILGFYYFSSNSGKVYSNTSNLPRNIRNFQPPGRVPVRACDEVYQQKRTNGFNNNRDVEGSMSYRFMFTMMSLVPSYPLSEIVHFWLHPWLLSVISHSNVLCFCFLLLYIRISYTLSLKLPFCDFHLLAFRILLHSTRFSISIRFPYPTVSLFWFSFFQ